MDERRPVVKRQLAVSGNRIAVVVDHVGNEDDSFEDVREHELPSFDTENGTERPIKPKFHLESSDEQPSLPSDNEHETFENCLCLNGHNKCNSQFDRPVVRNGFMRPSLSVEMAGSMSQRRGSAITVPEFESNEPAFGANLMRVSVSACNLLSLQNASYAGHQGRHQNGDQNRYIPRFATGGLSEPESMGGSCESLPDVCLTTPSGAKRPLTAPYLSSIPAYLSAAKLSSRGRSSSSGWTGGYSNFHKSNTSPPPTIHKGYATAAVCGPTLGSLFGRQSSVRSSWAGEEYSLHDTSSLDLYTFRGDQHLRHVKTEQFMSRHALKAKSSKLQLLLDKAFALIGIESERTVSEGLSIVIEVMSNAWYEPKIGVDLASGLCNYLR